MVVRRERHKKDGLALSSAELALTGAEAVCSKEKPGHRVLGATEKCIDQSANTRIAANTTEFHMHMLIKNELNLG